MSISIYGSEEIFPTDTKVKEDTVNGFLADYNDPEDHTFIDKIFSITGAPFLVILIISIGVYVFLWFAHKDKKILRNFKRIAFSIPPLEVYSRTVHNTLIFKERTYDHTKFEQYSDSLRRVKERLGGEEDTEEQ